MTSLTLYDCICLIIASVFSHGIGYVWYLIVIAVMMTAYILPGRQKHNR